MADERLNRAEKVYEALKSGATVNGLKNQEGIRKAIRDGQLRWGMTSKGGYKPLVPGDAEYDKGFASPREALHFVQGKEPDRTIEGKTAGALFAPVSQHRMHDNIRADQRSAAADIGQDVFRGIAKGVIPAALALGINTKLPGVSTVLRQLPTLGRAGAGAVSSATSGLNTPISAARHDPYGEPIGQTLATALATGLGIALARHYTPNQQAYRDSERKVINRLGALGQSKQESKRVARKAADRLVHGLPAMTYGDWVSEPITNFDKKYVDAATTPTKLEPVAPVIEGYYNDKGEWVGGKVKARRPLPVKETVTTEGIKVSRPGGKGQKIVTDETTVTNPEKTTTTKTTTVSRNGRTAKQSSKEVVGMKLPTISNDEARRWLVVNHIDPTQPGVMDKARELLNKAYLDQTSQEGLILFGNKGNRMELPKQDLTRYLADPTVNSVMQELLREKSYFEDPTMNKDWKGARKQNGSRRQIARKQGLGQTAKIVSPDEFNNKRTSWLTRGKSLGAGAIGFMLPVLTELLYNRVKDKKDAK
jgi:hypothetical protein